MLKKKHNATSMFKTSLNLTPNKINAILLITQLEAVLYSYMYSFTEWKLFICMLILY